MSDLPTEDWVVLASIVRPQGRDGEVIADLLTDFPERFAERRRLFLLSPPRGGKAQAPRQITLERHRLHQGRVVLKFTGADSIDQAESLRGLDVAIPRSERVPLEDGAVYIADLLGCRLFDSAQGREIGVITAVDRESTTTDLLVVASPGGEETLVPFVKAYSPVVDLAAKRISMKLPEGLVDLNVKTSAEPDEEATAESDGSMDVPQNALRSDSTEELNS